MELVILQCHDKSLEKYRDRKGIKVKGEQKVSFEETDSVRTGVTSTVTQTVLN